MATYLEIKQALKLLFGIDAEVDENCDLAVPCAPFAPQEIIMTLPNEALKTAYDNMQTHSNDQLEMWKDNYREVALQALSPYHRSIDLVESIVDDINGFDYSISPASAEYCLFVLNEIAELFKRDDTRSICDLKGHIRIHVRHSMRAERNIPPLEWLSHSLRLVTMKIRSNQPADLEMLRKCATSFKFQFMYKKGIAYSEHANIEDMYSIGNSMVRFSRDSIDSPPLRVYDKEVLDYYTMALETRDPFTTYISFYHIVEYFFDKVFYRKLVEDIREKLTLPSFSYKNDEDIYQLAQHIRRRIKNDDDSVKGNEKDALKYVLMEYVPIGQLIEAINSIDANAVKYYENNLVPFTTSKKTRIAWTDVEGVYTNLATRIYETRNALVHSKSTQVTNQYRPYQNKKDLVLEIALMKAVADLVVMNSSEIM